jgi:hypothetical protein
VCVCVCVCVFSSTPRFVQIIKQENTICPNMQAFLWARHIGGKKRGRETFSPINLLILLLRQFPWGHSNLKLQCHPNWRAWWSPAPALVPGEESDSVPVRWCPRLSNRFPNGVDARSPTLRTIELLCHFCYKITVLSWIYLLLRIKPRETHW